MTIQVDTRDIRVNIEVNERNAERKLDKLGDAAEKAGESFEEMADQATDAGKATDKAGDGFKRTGEDLGYLNKQIKEGKNNLRDLAREFDRTGDSSLLKDINKQRRDVRKFENVAKLLLPDGDTAGAASQAGTAFGENLVSSAAKAIASGNPYIIGAVTGLALASAPAVGSLLAAAVVGGVGAGGIIGGIALAAQDPRLQSVASDVGDSLLSGLQDAAEPFVEPLITSLQKIGNAGWVNKLAPAFEALSKSVGPLTDGLTEFGDEVIDGLVYGLTHAGPLLEVLGDSLPRLGEALGGVITALASDTDGAAAAVQMLVGGMALLIETAGGAVYVLGQIYEKAVDLAEVAGLVHPRKQLIEYSGALDKAGGETKNLVKDTQAAEKALEDFDAAISRVFNRTLGLKEAQIGYQQAIDDLKEELTDGKRTLDENTEAGRDNWASIIDTTRAIEELREANVANGMSMDDANAKYDAQLEDLRKTLLSLGYNKEAVNKYIAEMKGIPSKAQTEIYLKGINEALAKVKELAGAIGAITGYGILQVIPSLGARASGGPVSPGMNYVVGENGPELLSMKSGGGGHVYNAGQTSRMLGSMGGGQQIHVTVVGGDPLARAVAEHLRFEIRTTANGDPIEYFS